MNDSKSLRVLFLGEGRTGKTSIIKRFITNQFEDVYRPTVEDIFRREFIVRHCMIDIELLDTGGFYNFIGMRKIYIKTSVAFVLVFAHDSYSSFKMCKDLFSELKQERGDELYSIPLVIVCNKSDATKTEVGEVEIMDWLIKSYLKPSQFVYCSAKNNENVVDVFESLWIQNFNSENPLMFIDLKSDKKQPRRFSSSEMNKLFFCSTSKSIKDEHMSSESSVINIPMPSKGGDSCWTQSPVRSVDNHLRSPSPIEIKSSNSFLPSADRLKRHSTKGKRKYRNRIILNCTIS